MNKKLYFAFIILIISLSIHCNAQSFITIDGSQVFSNLKFTNSNGQKDKSYSNIITGGYSIGYRIYKKGLFARLNVGMRKGGATMVYNNSNITWGLQYCDVRLGVGYELDKWRIKPYVSASGYYSFLLKATQSMDGLNYDIKKNKSVKSSDYGVLLVPGIKVFISDYISIYSEFSYLIGLQNLETNTKQKLNNTGYSISLGIAATITKSKPKWLQGKK
jgi:hypothetical protein